MVSQWITGEESRAEVHRLRARSSAVLTGSGTVLADDPSLNARPADIDDFVPPVRVVLDSSLRTSPQAKLFSVEGPILICHASDDEEKAAALTAAGAELMQVPAHRPGEVKLDLTLQQLGEYGLNDILVESGSLLNAGLLDDYLIDELIVFQAGCVLGDTAQGMFGLEPLASLKDRYEFELQDVRRFGPDVRMIWRTLRAD